MLSKLNALGGVLPLSSRLLRTGLLALMVLLSLCFSAQAMYVVSQQDIGNITVMEVTGDYNARLPDTSENKLARQQIAQEFYAEHLDQYDFLVFFTNFDFEMLEPNSAAFYSHVKNDVQGIGLPLIDSTALYGSSNRLQGTIDMGNVASTVTDPVDPEFETSLFILSHEMMHRWGAQLEYIGYWGRP